MRTFADRLRHFLEQKGLTASSFAEVVGVQRSNVSHLLSGRNNPSLDFIIKMTDVYSELDLRWLLRGEEEKLRYPYPTKESSPNKEVATKTFLNKEVVDAPSTIDNKSETKDDKILLNAKRSIQKIILLYEDGSFSVHE